MDGEEFISLKCVKKFFASGFLEHLCEPILKPEDKKEEVISCMTQVLEDFFPDRARLSFLDFRVLAHLTVIYLLERYFETFRPTSCSFPCWHHLDRGGLMMGLMFAYISVKSNTWNREKDRGYHQAYANVMTLSPPWLYRQKAMDVNRQDEFEAAAYSIFSGMNLDVVAKRIQKRKTYFSGAQIALPPSFPAMPSRCQL